MHERTRVRVAAWWFALAAAWAAPAGAITLGQSDGFDAGSLDGWSSGVVHPAPPVALPDGGPGGVGDGYLQLTALGGTGAGSRLVAFAGTAWTGDWLAAGVDAVSLDLNNHGPDALSLRLYVVGNGIVAITRDAITLPAGGGWTHARFDLHPDALDGSPAALGQVFELRLYHGMAAVYPGDAVRVTLGVDNVTAVPEPASALLLAGGLWWMRRTVTRRTAR